MLKNYQLHISRALFISILLFCLLQFPCIQIKAQDDTAAVIEQVQEEPPPETDEYTDDSEEEADEKNYFNDKGQNDSVQVIQRKVPDSITKAMQDDDDFWYANTAIEKKKEEKKNSKRYTPIGQQTWVKTLIWIVIIGGFAAAIMWYLADSNTGLFRKKNKIEKTTAEEVEMEDIFTINYQKEIDKAAAQGNHRLAVRLMFLRLLKNMSEKNIINYKQDRTNFDYLLELHSTNYYKNFFRITRNYEYTWYGHFEVNEDAYKIIRNDFDQFERTLIGS